MSRVLVKVPRGKCRCRTAPLLTDSESYELISPSKRSAGDPGDTGMGAAVRSSWLLQILLLSSSTTF